MTNESSERGLLHRSTCLQIFIACHLYGPRTVQRTNYAALSGRQCQFCSRISGSNPTKATTICMSTWKFLEIQVWQNWKDLCLPLQLCLSPPKLETIHVTSRISLSSVQIFYIRVFLSAKTNHLTVNLERKLSSVSTSLMFPKFRAIWRTI